MVGQCEEDGGSVGAKQEIREAKKAADVKVAMESKRKAEAFMQTAH